MVREDIFAIEFPKNEQLRSFFKLKKLNDEFAGTRLFEQKATLIASRLPVNSIINSKIKSSPEYFTTWQKLCSFLFSYLLGPAKFLDRSDADDLVCLPIATKIQIGKSLQMVRAISIYNAEKWIGTLFFRDPEFNNEFSFFGQNGFKSVGSWASKVRADVQNYNMYGLTKTATLSVPTISKSTILEASEAVGNTITVRDVFAKIEEMKKEYSAGNY